ncbi:YkoF family thiamine/hydroxymethylpyrimidine-binding protein [Clostridiaceae bacterium 35-E11]
MCPLEKNRIASCEITYFPIQSENYLEDIHKVLELIQSYPVNYEIGVLSTTIRGDKDTLFKLIKDIYDKMEADGCYFTISVMMSNICGCQL